MSLFSAEDNELLTRTGAATPMGELVRSYWFPAFLAERLPDVDADPFAITLLGEDLVAFRGKDGTVGLLDRYCPHRRASLVLARVEDDCALRCVYHGWKIRADGQVLETPPEPPNSKFAQSVTTTSYPTREAGGMVWTYMGPRESMPAFPDFPFNVVPRENVWANHFYQPSNWLQGLEGDVDAAHAGYLHYTKDLYQWQLENLSQMGKYLFDPSPKADFEVAPWGLQTVLRFALEDPSEAVFWIHPFVMPFFTLFAIDYDGFTGGNMHAWVPTDDGGHYVYSVMWSNEGPFPDDVKASIDEGLQYSAVDKANGYRPSGWVDGGYPQDRDAMHADELFSGYDGVNLQDLAVQHSMGPIVDRTKEHLGVEDFLVIQLRRYLLEALRRHAGGDPLPGLQPGLDLSQIEYRWLVAPSDTPMHEVLERKDWNSAGALLPVDREIPTNAWGALVKH